MGEFDYDELYRAKLQDAARGFANNPVKKTAKRLAEILSPRGPDGRRKILDLGAGDGRHTLYFADKGFEVTAVDKSEPAIGILEVMARHNPRIHPVRADITQIELLPEEQFDAAICTYVMQDLSQPQAIAAAEYLRDHVVKGGYLVAAVFLGKYKSIFHKHIQPLFQGWSTVKEEKGKTQTVALCNYDTLEILLQKK